MSHMATRQWMVTHEWMVKPMHQREWIERRGIMIWIAETFTSLGAGLYLVSLFINSWWGLLIGWLIIMFIKLPIHLAYFGKPWRFYRTMPPWSNAWKTSWFARGILFSVLFGMFGFVQLVFGQPDLVNLIGSSICNPIYYTFGVLAGLNALGVGIYGGFIMNYVKGIPFWNQGLLPVVIMLAGIADGFGLMMGVGSGRGRCQRCLGRNRQPLSTISQHTVNRYLYYKRWICLIGGQAFSSGAAGWADGLYVLGRINIPGASRAGRYFTGTAFSVRRLPPSC